MGSTGGEGGFRGVCRWEDTVGVVAGFELVIMALRLDVSDMFEAWEKDFQRLISSVKQRAAALEAASPGLPYSDDKEPVVILYKQDLGEAEKCVRAK